MVSNREDKQNNNLDRKYIVMDIVFYGNSLNYDQGGSNYQELKKITKWDGRQYILVSRYALRYSILHHATKLFPDRWKLAGNNELSVEDVVVHPKRELVDEKSILNFPEFDLFGFLIAEKKKDEKEGSSVSRISPVKISHAISLTPYNYDSHFMANLDMMRRAGRSGSNPVTIEEKKDFYVYNVVIDVNRVGVYTKEESGNEEDIKLPNNERIQRIRELIETIFYLKREIKGRMEDLSPCLVICGLYNNGKYVTFLDRIELAKSNIYKVITKTKKYTDSEGRNIEEVENEIVEKYSPKFIIDMTDNNYVEVNNLKELHRKIEEFLNSNNNAGDCIFLYKRENIEVDTRRK